MNSRKAVIARRKIEYGSFIPIITANKICNAMCEDPHARREITRAHEPSLRRAGRSPFVDLVFHEPSDSQQEGKRLLDIGNEEFVDVRRPPQTALTQLGIPISGLAIHPVVKMASFRLSFEDSHTSAGQEPGESRQGVAVATTSPYVYKQLHSPQAEREQAIQRSFLQQYIRSRN
jgi:hypothetical protein